MDVFFSLERSLSSGCACLPNGESIPDAMRRGQERLFDDWTALSSRTRTEAADRFDEGDRILLRSGEFEWHWHAQPMCRSISCEASAGAVGIYVACSDDLSPEADADQQSPA